MFYVYPYTPGASDTEADPYEIKAELTAGVIHQIDILFQSGCAHEEFVQIWEDNFQIWPSNRGTAFRGNATVISFREYYRLIPGGTGLTIKIWTTLAAAWKEIVVNIGLLPQKVLTPITFEELLEAAAGR